MSEPSPPVSLSLSSPSSPSSFTQSGPYDVFLSFRGEDTRKTFTDHLYTALDRQGIRTFIDDDLPRGEEISPQLLKAIEDSKISVIVFSENYASSCWCVGELVKILECKKSKGQMVRPIFYKVDPSDVRHQRSSFGHAFAHHELKFKDDMEKVLKWRRALTEAANLSGSHLKEDEYEAKFIGKVVEEISIQLINKTYFGGPAYKVGLESRVTDVNKLLGVDGNGRCMVGIWGIPGIGKTTIAKAVYNSIAHKFEGICFLADVRGKSSVYGLIELQKNLLCQILGDKNFNLITLDQGINVIKQRLRHKRILLTLDDVNQLDQLNNLAGDVDWFGEGSRVIVTTRDRGLLTRHGIELIYEVKKLAYQDALELFSMMSFKNKEPPNDYLVLARRAIACAQYLPLALTILGSHLRNQKLEYWNSTLHSYEARPFEEIQKILRTSYGSLTNREQQVFLDIAFFFKGKDMDYVIQALKCRKLDSPENCIQELVENAIITIEDNRILMHDLLEQMGKDVVHEKSPNEPGRRSRLCCYEDVHEVLTENTGTNEVKGIVVNFPEDDDIPLNADSFSGMKNLEIFINKHGTLSGETLNYLSKNLRVIEWNNCQLQYLPSNFHPKELVVFDMRWSRIRQLGEGFKNLAKLTSLNLRDCGFLEKIPDFSGMENLKYLEVTDCTSLIEVHPSVGFLDKLVTLDLSRCSNLTNCPPRICLKSLQKMILSGCKRLENFPEIVDNMDSLWLLNIEESGIRELPSSIVYLSGLEDLIAHDCCENLATLSSSIYYLKDLFLFNCKSLEKISTLSSIFEQDQLPKLQYLDLTNSHRLCAHSSDYYPARMENFCKIRNRTRIPFIIILPGNEIPKWFSSVLEIPSSWFIKIPRNLVLEKTGLALCVVYELTGENLFKNFFGIFDPHRYVEISINGILVQRISDICFSTDNESTSHVWFNYSPWDISWGQLEGGICQVTFTIALADKLKILSCGIHLVYDQDGDGGDDSYVDVHEPSPAVMAVDDDTKLNIDLSSSLGPRSTQNMPNQWRIQDFFRREEILKSYPDYFKKD